jgi:hypothetical protein
VVLSSVLSVYNRHVGIRRWEEGSGGGGGVEGGGWGVGGVVCGVEPSETARRMHMCLRLSLAQDFLRLGFCTMACVTLAERDSNCDLKDQIYARDRFRPGWDSNLRPPTFGTNTQTSCHRRQQVSA